MKAKMIKIKKDTHKIIQQKQRERNKKKVIKITFEQKMISWGNWCVFEQKHFEENT